MSAVSPCPAENLSELSRFWREMRPTPGRMASSLRFALMSALAVLFMLVLQIPVIFIAPALFSLLLVSHDTPRRCVRELVLCQCAAILATAAAIFLLAATGTDPVARVIGVAVFTFLAVFFARTSVIPGLAMAFGCVTYMVISLWDYHMPAERTLHRSLWALSSTATALCAAAIVQYLFNRSDPLAVLHKEIGARCAALGRLFELNAANGGAPALEEQLGVVRRLAAGDTQLHALLDSVSSGACGGAGEAARLRAVVLALDRLLVLGAAFSMRDEEAGVQSARLRAAAAALSAVAEGRLEQIGSVLGEPVAARPDTLDLIESTLRRLGENESWQVAKASIEATPNISWRDRLRSLLLPDAFTNDAHFIHALKLSLCATICYVIYNGLKWPGISTAFWTVYFTGLGTTGTTNRKLLFRVIGSTVGGVILGLGCLVFVFPNLEGVTGFLLVIAAISFIGFWIMGSSYFGYIGMQIVFSFNLLAFETSRIPGQITPARDRLLGIGIAFLVMFLVFHQVRPERTVDTMRRLLARLLETQAELISMTNTGSSPMVARKFVELRRQVNSMLVNLHGFADGLKFEFPPDRTADMQLSDGILSAAACAEALLLHLRTWAMELDGEKETPYLRGIRAAIENGLRDLSWSLQATPGAQREGRRMIIGVVPEGFRDGIPTCVAKAVDSFQELQMACDGIERLTAQEESGPPVPVTG